MPAPRQPQFGCSKAISNALSRKGRIVTDPPRFLFPIRAIASEGPPKHAAPRRTQKMLQPEIYLYSHEEWDWDAFERGGFEFVFANCF